MPQRPLRLLALRLLALRVTLCVAASAGVPQSASAQATAAAAGPAAPAALPAVPTRDQRLLALSTFWSEAKRSFAYFDKLGPTFDWDSIYVATIPRILAAEDYATYVREMQRFAATLRDGHTVIRIPQGLVAARYWDGPWLALRDVDGRVIISNTDTVLADSVPIGSEVLAIDGVPVETRLQRDVMPFIAASAPHVWRSDAVRFAGVTGIGLLSGRADSPMAVEIERPDGRRATLRLRRDQRGRASRWLRVTLPAPLVEARPLAGGVLYLAINSFNDAALDQALDSLRPQMDRARAIVLDLRRNPGGVSGNGYRALQNHFATRDFTTSAWRSRTEIQSRRAWGKFDAEAGRHSENREHWEGARWYSQPGERLRITDKVLPETVPIAVLIGRNTGSAAEDFLIAGDGDPRFTLVGEPSNGSTGQPLFIDLPGGIQAWICTKRDTYPDGREFVGIGVQPHVRVVETVASVRAGSDPVLQEAERVLQRRLGAR